MNIKMSFKFLGALLLFSALFYTTGCNLLKNNVDNIDLKKFRDKNQAHIDSMLRSATRSAALGIADTAKLISQNLISGLKGSMDTLDPDFQKLKLKIEELGNLTDDQLAKLGNQLELRVKNLKADIKTKIEEVDRPAAALIRDLKQRGMLDDTLVVFGGEFGRTPMSQGGSGRDHHIKGFSIMMAGGGIKGGTAYGNTDELGYAAVENPVSVHDLHATLLHLFGVEHTRLTYKFQGRNFRLTDVSGEVVRPILA